MTDNLFLRQRYEEELAELRALYEERHTAGDFKACLDIKLKIARLDVIYLGKAEEPMPESFKTQTGVVRFLTKQGYKANDSTLSLHIKERKLIPAEDGEYRLETVLAYAEEYLTNLPEQAKRGRQDETAKQKKEIDLEMARLDLAERQKTLVNAAEIRDGLKNMLVTFRTRVLLLPRKLSHQLAEIDEPHRIEELLDQELRGCLTSLAEYRIGEAEEGA